MSNVPNLIIAPAGASILLVPKNNKNLPKYGYEQDTRTSVGGSLDIPIR